MANQTGRALGAAGGTLISTGIDTAELEGQKLQAKKALKGLKDPTGADKEQADKYQKIIDSSSAQMSNDWKISTFAQKITDAYHKSGSVQEQAVWNKVQDMNIDLDQKKAGDIQSRAGCPTICQVAAGHAEKPRFHPARLAER